MPFIHLLANIGVQIQCNRNRVENLSKHSFCCFFHNCTWSVAAEIEGELGSGIACLNSVPIVECKAHWISVIWLGILGYLFCTVFVGVFQVEFVSYNATPNSEFAEVF
uniref:Uncharacterized protein n=1 Tax=Anguilla anguilla TaxID=7936 RepID=A0A0E9WUL9_ANGAN